MRRSTAKNNPLPEPNLGRRRQIGMEKLADQGDGFYAYVETFAEARRLFGRDLTGTLTPVARGARTRSTQE